MSQVLEVLGGFKSKMKEGLRGVLRKLMSKKPATAATSMSLGNFEPRIAHVLFNLYVLAHRISMVRNVALMPISKKLYQQQVQSHRGLLSTCSNSSTSHVLERMSKYTYCCLVCNKWQCLSSTEKGQGGNGNNASLGRFILNKDSALCCERPEAGKRVKAKLNIKTAVDVNNVDAKTPNSAISELRCSFGKTTRVPLLGSILRVNKALVMLCCVCLKPFDMSNSWNTHIDGICRPCSKKKPRERELPTPCEICTAVSHRQSRGLYMYDDGAPIASFRSVSCCPVCFKRESRRNVIPRMSLLLSSYSKRLIDASRR